MLRVVALASCVCVACADPSNFAPSPEEQPHDSALESLRRETGFEWRGRWHADLRTPARLVGRTAPLAVTVPGAGRASRSFVLAHRELFGILDRDDDIDLQEGERDELGMVHVRLAQSHRGLLVDGAHLFAHFSDTGSLIEITGRTLSLGDVDLTTQITAETARAIAEAAARAHSGELVASASTTAPVQLVRAGAPSHVVWRVHTELHSTRLPVRLDVFVDARGGLVEDVVDGLRSLRGEGRGVFGERRALEVTAKNDRFWLEDGTRGTSPLKTYTMANRTRLPGGIVSSPLTSRWDEEGRAPGAAVDAHAFAAAAFDYFAVEHGRLGWSASTGVHVAVHFGDRLTNAFFDGRTIVFGDGDGSVFSPLAAASDVVGHEYTHGVIANSASLVPYGESGALDEAIADLFGVLIEDRVAGACDWRVGEAIFHPSGWAAALRDLRDPSRTRNPDHVSDQLFSLDDSGGVHANSTIASHAAYLMAEGGEHRFSGVRVEGIGRSRTARLWYRALVRYLTPLARFRDAADALESAARDLDPEALPTVEAAWRAVGVLR